MRQWTGTLGKMLSRVNDLPINPDFDPIPVDASSPLIALSDEVMQNLSGDQKYGYRMLAAIRSSDLQQDLAAMKTGTLSHSHCLTTANAFMRLYVSSHGLTDPTVLNTLKIITTFIVGVYYPCWFEIKVKHNWLDGPRHVLHQLQLLQLQDSATQELLRPYVESSCWYAHSEMVLQQRRC